MTHLSRKLTCAALLPSTYSVLGLPGSSSTTPSNVAPKFGAAIVTLLACGSAPRALRGNSALRNASAPLRSLALIAATLLPPSSTSSGVSGGVAMPGGGASRFARMARGGVGKGNAGGWEALESLKLSEPNDDSVVRGVSGVGGAEDGGVDARLSVTQSDDPLSGGHFAVGVSKAPLRRVRMRAVEREEGVTYPRPARERSRVVVHRVVALDVADGKHARDHVGRESPISNGLTTVAAEENSHWQVLGANGRKTYVGQILDDCLD